MSFPNNPALDDERWDVGLNDNLTQIKAAIGTPTTISGHTTTLATHTADLVSQGGRLTAAEAGILLSGSPAQKYAARNVVMASPPTVTQGSTAAITGQVIDLRTDPRILWVSGPTVLSADVGWIVSQGFRRSDGALDTTGGYDLSFEFMVDCAALELRILAFSTKVMLTVDGEKHIATQSVTDNSGASRYMKFAFGGRTASGAPRRIRVTMTQGFVKELNLTAVDTLLPIVDDRAPMLAVLGDSYGTGYAARSLTNVYDGYPQQLARLLGFNVSIQSCISSTGMVATSGVFGTYDTRVDDVIALAPDVVLVQGSINDRSLLPADIEDAAVAIFTRLRGGLPNASIVSTGLLDAAGGSTTGDAAASAAIQSAATTVGIPFISTAGWVTGTGYAGATTGDGNGDIYTHTDHSHPTTAGGFYLATRLAAEITTILGAS